MRRVQLDDKRLAAIQDRVERMQEALPEILGELRRLRMLAALGRPASQTEPPRTLREAQTRAERECLLAVGERARWNRSEMARVLGLDRKSVHRKLHQHDLMTMGNVAMGRPRKAARRRSRG